ncbi:cystathionine beta-lyase [Variovorax sp. OV329]|uniref:cystathionine beta-lyase n=1 Tax=Variovorax sp. OV329 TaxID=1882825 RepID=UPI0008E9DAB7|nr:cystathionine beta-lyase [Variovorax sp. OV329]SFM04430.1 cystathionine beta-lyase [Variovorax sp. OV329]
MTTDTEPSKAFDSLSPPVWRASTIVFDSLDDFVARRTRQPDGFSYGVTGTPTTRELERRIAALEDGRHCIVLPSGQAALVASLLTFVRRGDHLLVSAACYGALKAFADGWLASFGVAVEYFDPAIGEEIEDLFRPQTQMIYLEAPGSITMEMHDSTAIARAARRHGVTTMMDNTWAGPLGFRPLAHGIDLSIEAATKYMGGHSDLLMGSIATNDAVRHERLRETQSVLGHYVSPEDCFLVMRGLETMRLRQEAQSAAALSIARWLQRQSAVQEMLYPPLPADRGHALWKRDYKTSGCLFSMVLRPAPESAHRAFFDALERFAIGASWGGVHSLAAYYPAALQAARPFARTDQPIVRLSIGLEGAEALIPDLERALAAYGRAADAGATAP